MPNFLNLTLPINQDEASQKAIREFVEQFGKESQPKVNAILRGSRLVHHARAIAILNGDKVAFLQVITEYDGDLRPYTIFFSEYLPTFFEALFKFVPGGLSLNEIKDPEKLMRFIEKHDLPSLGKEELRFSAYSQSVKEIQDKFGIVPPALPEKPR